MPPLRQLDIEVTEACDHRCSHCYNVWHAAPRVPTRSASPPLQGQPLLDLVTRAVRESGCELVNLTGGEPLLGPDTPALVRTLRGLGCRVQLITNGAHVDEEMAATLVDAGLTSVQLTFLAGRRELHDRLKGATCFDETQRAALRLAERGVAVGICFVALRPNAGELPGVLELAAALGARLISYNRMAPAGRVDPRTLELLPTVEQVERDLEWAQRDAPRWGLKVFTAMPIPPCLVRHERYPAVRFGFCSSGTSQAKPVLTAGGEVRSCNLSSVVLGNLQTTSWTEIMAHPWARELRRALPRECVDCVYSQSCVGGCRESALAVGGTREAPDPFVARARQ